MSKKKKEIHVDKLIVKANEVIIMSDDDRKHGDKDRDRDRDRDPWFGFLRGDRRVRDLDDVRDDEFKKDDDVLGDFDDKKDDRRDFDDDRRDDRDDVEDRRRPWWF